VTRTRASAKAAGSRFERLVADYLKAEVSEFIDRRVKTGAKDRGDISNLRVHGKRVVAELKDSARINVGAWLAEAETERGNDDALAGVVIFKRTGKGKPADQIVLMTLADFVAVITAARPEES
jgi:hypothetical protein